MKPANELRISFKCPVNGRISVAARLKRIKDGKVHVDCSACGGQHFIQPQEGANSDADVADAIDNIEGSLEELRTTIVGLDKAASNMHGHLTDAENGLSDLRAGLDGKAAA